MKCPRCQHENRPGAKFCEECAAPLARACINCGAQLSATAKFCSECAHPAGPASPPGPQRFGAPETYTPKHLAERILTSKTALEGERKQVTVLFADMKGSMELLADRDPEEARRILDPVLERMMEAVHRYEGTVNQVMGDGIMALFGAPLAHEDHAARACYAALRMQESVARYVAEIHRDEGVPLQIRIGVNSGEVLVRSIGSDLRMDYTAVGQTTHLAARMEQMAMPGSILIAADCLRLAEGYVVVRPLGPRPVKGLNAPVEVYEIIGTSRVRSRLHTAAARGLTRFVGRHGELDQLHQALERARTGHGEVIAVVGEPGVGKSRLYWEFIHSKHTQGCLIVESGSTAGQATAFLPVVELLKAYFQIEPSDDVMRIGEKVTSKLLSLDRLLEPFLPALLWILDVPVEDAQWQRLDPRQRRRRTLDGVTRLLLRESQAQPLLLLFEDLHWIDEETQALLDSLVESLPTARLLLLVNYRREYQHGWGSKTYYRQIRIDPLPPASAEELLSGLLGEDPTLEPLTRLLIERTEGNPFFLEESVRTLVETGALAGKRGAYRLEKAPQSLQIPPTVQAILTARIDRLAPADKRLLQAASVVGKDVPFVLLQAIADEGEDALRQGLDRLRAAEFLYETRLSPDREYTFRHALTHEVAYGSLLQDRRRELHRRIVATMETLSSNRIAEEVDRLAHHAVRAEVWDKAVIYLRQAGAKAAARSAYREAAGWFEQALGVLQHLPERRDTIEQAIDLRLDLRNSLHPLGEFRRTLAPLREAETLAEGLDDPPRLARVSACLSQYCRLMESPERAIESGQRALVIAGALGDFALQIVSNVSLGQAYRARGDYRRAIDALRRNVAALQGYLLQEGFGQLALPSVLSRTWLARCLAEQGEFAEGTSYAEEAVQIAESADHPNTLVHAYYGLGLVCLHKGDFEKAIVVLDRGLKLHRPWDLLSWFPAIASSLGFAYALSGRVAEALPLLEKAIEYAGSIKLLGRQSLRMAQLGEAYLLAGRTDEAIELAGRALSFAREYEERGNQAWALLLLGEIASQCGPPHLETAEPHFRQALALAEELGMRPLVAHCHLGLGKLYRRTSKREQAREHLATATTMYREMGMTYWLEKAEAEVTNLRT
jgi:class 3 adenylate cyclase/tetratricopeptide (TPR) repeat protein